MLTFLWTLYLCGLALGEAPAASFQLTLVPLRQGYESEASQDSYRKFLKNGLNLQEWIDANVVADYRNKKLLQLFYTTVTDPSGGQRPLIQRSKRTIKEYRSASDTRPAITTDYMVEVFKTKNGKMKRPDRHHGIFPLGKWYRREIVKELEIGHGEIRGGMSGQEWPFGGKTLYRQLQPYSPKPDLYEAVLFSQSKRWTIDVRLNGHGAFSVSAPELDIMVDSPPKRSK
jgi:hypothetical protein